VYLTRNHLSIARPCGSAADWFSSASADDHFLLIALSSNAHRWPSPLILRSARPCGSDVVIRMQAGTTTRSPCAIAKDGTVVELREALKAVSPDRAWEVCRDALCYASGYGNRDTALYLLGIRADPNATTPTCVGRNALHEASMWDCGAAVILLLEFRADPAIRTDNKSRRTAWGVAEKAQAINALEILRGTVAPPRPVPIPSCSSPLRPTAPALAPGQAAARPAFKTTTKRSVPMQLQRETLAQIEDFCARLRFEPRTREAAMGSGSDTCVDLRNSEVTHPPGPGELPGTFFDLPNQDAGDASRDASAGWDAEPSSEWRKCWKWRPPARGFCMWGVGTADAAAAPAGRTRAQWQRLPIERWREEIVSTVRYNPVVILRGDTGSGKSTQVPQFILDGAPAHEPLP